jgi:uncharacterized protein YceK
MLRTNAMAIVVTAALSDCGTTVNMLGSCCGAVRLGGGDQLPRVYGGVLLDAEAARESGNEALQTKGLECVERVAGAVCYLAVDLPLSAIADTLTLPLTIPTAIQKMSAQTENDSKKRNRETEVTDHSPLTTPPLTK